MSNSHISPTRKLSSKTRCLSFILASLFLVLVLTKMVHFWNVTNTILDKNKMNIYSGSFPPVFHFPPLPVLSRNETFGACLMVKGDNDLLAEWIPYHYTVLPLRYILVVTDDGNLEDPELVLKKWTVANTDLHWWVVNVSQFESMHGIFHKEQAESKIHRKHTGTQSNETIFTEMVQYVAHSRLVHKQKAMITYCSRFMKERGVSLVSMYDTDEFLAINRVGVTTGNLTHEDEPLDESFGIRPSLPLMESNATVVDIVHSFEGTRHSFRSCHTMPRVSFGAIENFTCPGSEDTKEFARVNFGNDSLSTLRFQKHAVKEDFSKNRFGKVFIDVSKLSDKTLSTTPKNIHRPFRDECIRPTPVFQQAPFYLMHYAGGWERFQAKDDKRRGFEQWKELADVGDSSSCCQEEIHRWLPRFVNQVGLVRAKFLLGKTISENHQTRGAKAV